MSYPELLKFAVDQFLACLITMNKISPTVGNLQTKCKSNNFIIVDILNLCGGTHDCRYFTFPARSGTSTN